MIYKNKKEWENSTNKRVSLLGMSGLGKTKLSNMLQSTFSWFHFSVDYRIGTRYLDEHIVDNFKIVSIKDHSNEKYIETGQDTIVLIIQKRKKRTINIKYVLKFSYYHNFLTLCKNCPSFKNPFLVQTNIFPNLKVSNSRCRTE